MNTDNLLGIFIDESKENLQFLSDKLLELEQEPDNFEILNEIFRAAHTLKGMAKTMGFNGMSDLTHNLENLLELLRSGQKKANEKVVNLLFQGLDKLEVLVGTIIDTGEEKECPGVNELVKELEKILKGEDDQDDEQEQASGEGLDFSSYEALVLQEALEKGLKPVEFSVFIENDCVLPGARCYMVSNALEGEGEIFKILPSVEEVENNVFLTSDKYKHLVKFYVVTENEPEEIKKKILAISEIVKVEIKHLKELPQEVATEETEQPKQKGEEVKAAASKQQAKVSSQTIRVNSERLDSLVNLVGELVINKTRISQLSSEIGNSDLSEVTTSVETITGEIQEIVMKLRMVPIEQVFSRFPRLVRDISKNMDKDVNFVIKGQEIEIDRAIVDEIADPLVHLIRNAMDHGLETKEERIKAGKKVKGTLQLIALNECDNILIKIIDDGKGIDPDKIAQKAIEKGFIQKKDLETMSQSDIIELLFKPGFSTAEQATELSGRGVGMDVVNTNITALNGTVNIKSEVGQGTTVTISLPSTMAIIQSMLVGVGDETYALPLNYINEVIDVSKDQVKFIQNKEVINFRGNVIPIRRLDKMLQVPEYSRNGDDKLTLILMKSEENTVAVNVSRIISQQEVVIKNIDKNLSAKDYISGVTTLGNGQIALILNVNTLIR